MSMLTLNNDCLASVTAVPDLFLEQYMPAANGEFVKVYLYLLKLVKDYQQDSTLSSMADFFSCTENDIVRALKYWEKQGLLSLSYTAGESVPTGIAFLPLVRREESGILPTPEASISGPITAAPAVSAVPDEIPQAEQPQAPSPQPAVSAASVSVPADLLSESGVSRAETEKSHIPGSREELQHVLYVAQTYFGHLLSPTEIECIMFFYDDLHFSADLLEYLVEYCVSKGSTSIHYLKKVGLAWHESGIRDVASAKQETTTFNKHYYTILKAFGIRNRAPVEKEAEMMDRWLNTYGFTMDLITEACQRTVSKIGQPSFQYAEGILSKWKEQGVRSMADVQHRDAEHQKRKKAAPEQQNAARKNAPSASGNRFNNFHQREYDYQKLEEQLLK